MHDPHIGVAADLARADVRRHIRLLAAGLEDRLGWNTWEARRARHHRRLEDTRAMLHQAHESAMQHLGGDLPVALVAGEHIPIGTAVRAEFDGTVVAVIGPRMQGRDSRGRYVPAPLIDVAP